jgi:hypothetical protein
VDELLWECAASSPRPVDVILCGHDHGRVEYRYTRAAGESVGFELLTDFYTENPSLYYPCYTVAARRVVGGNPVFDPVSTRVVAGAPINGRVVSSPSGTWREAQVPPYARPLNRSRDARLWWEERRPLVLHTAAIATHNVSTRDEEVVPYPRPEFQGFRVLRIEDDVLRSIHYITLAAARTGDWGY